MKKLIIICCAACSVFSAQAQNATAKGWLDKAAAALSAAGTLSADFSINIKIQGISQNIAGTLDLKGNKYHLSASDMEIWFDGKTQWSLQKAAKEVNVSEPTAQEVQQFNPSFLLGLYKKDCTYNYLGVKKDPKTARKTHEVELIPQGKKTNLTKILLQIGDADAMPTKMHLFYRSKTENIIQINKYRKNLSLPDSHFGFDPKKHPNVDVIDLR
ncbi:membrane protein [Bacteroidia bacterium]|nr:membrane protein [Bacteroidia bacterium]